MRDLFLKFPSAEAAESHVYNVEYVPFINEDGGEVLRKQLSPRYRNMDVVGLIDSDVVAPPMPPVVPENAMIPEGETLAADYVLPDGYILLDGYYLVPSQDEAGQPVIQLVYEEPYIPVTYVPLPGWHVNIRALDDEDTASLEQFAVHPTNPRRVWA